MKHTSIETYRQIEQDETINREQKAVLICFAEHGPLTGRQLDEIMVNPDGHKRISELSRRGSLINLRTIKDEKTGRPAILWSFQSQGQLFKTEKTKKPTRAQLLARIAELEIICGRTSDRT